MRANAGQKENGAARLEPMAQGIPSEKIRRLVFNPGDDVERLVSEWVHRPALRELVQAFGGTWPTRSTLPSLLHHLMEFSAIWDLRAGASRSELPFIDSEVSPFNNVPAAADALGLVHQSPPTGEGCDYVYVLGGLATGTTSRIKYLKSLIDSDLIRPSQGIAVLGSFRRLTNKEHDFLAERYPELAAATTEVDLLKGQIDTAFPTDAEWNIDLDGKPTNDHRRTQLHAHRDSTPIQHVLAAASSDPERRPANTADTLEFAAERLALSAGAHLQLITSAIYAVYQFFDAIRVLGLRGMAIEMLGVPPEQSPTPQRPAAQVQELRSSIRSASLLLASSNDRSASGDGTARWTM